MSTTPVIEKPVQVEMKTSRVNTSAILGHEPGTGVAINVADVLSELQRTTVTERDAILSKPEDVQQIASNLLIRRVLAAGAERAGLASDPVMQASLAIAHDRILSDARLAQLDAQNTPDSKALDAYARDIYKTNLTKFEKLAQTHARHILLANNGTESMQKAKELLAQLRTGASFEELAKTHSTDPGSASRGGDLGFFGAGKMVAAFEEALNKLTKPGELSEPVISEFGLHLIRLEERHEKRTQTYDELKEALLAEARKAILNESRVQLVLSLNKKFVFDSKAIGSMGTPSSQ